MIPLPFRPLLKVFLSLFAVGGVIWLGTSLARMAIGFDAFVPGTTTLKDAQSEAMLVHTVWLYTLLGGWAGWSYAATVIGGTGAFLLSMRDWKRNGWIVMCSILMVLTIPGQVWVILQDIELWGLFDASTGLALASPEDVRTLFLQRMTAVLASVISGLTLLIAATVLLLLVWQPLRRPEPLTPLEPTA